MITLDQAFEIIKKEVKALKPASVPLAEVAGCLLDEDITASFDVPSFASSAMDGFAVRISDMKENGPWRLPIQNVIAAGDSAEQVLRKGFAAKIMTGAPLPDGADTIIPVEDVSIENNHVIINNRPEPGKFVRSVGDDIKKNERLYEKGEKLDPIAIGIIASLGKPFVQVIPKPKIAVVSTGSEIVNPGQQLVSGTVYNSNDYVLKAMLKNDGHRVSPMSKTSVDTVESLCSLFQQCFETNDLIISTGGVSMGDFDLVPDAVKRIGGEIIFHKVAVKPGKPVLFARISNGWLLGLPGNPVSALVGYHLYARRVIGQLGGMEFKPRRDRGKLTADLRIRGSRLCVIGSRIEENNRNILIYPTIRQKSGRLSSVKGINGFIFAEGGSRIIEKDSEVAIEWMN